MACDIEIHGNIIIPIPLSELLVFIIMVMVMVKRFQQKTLCPAALQVKGP